MLPVMEEVNDAMEHTVPEAPNSSIERMRQQARGVAGEAGRLNFARSDSLEALSQLEAHRSRQSQRDRSEELLERIADNTEEDTRVRLNLMPAGLED